MKRPRTHSLAVLTALLAAAFLLRLVGLGDVPLRGDEAFAVRYLSLIHISEPTRLLSSSYAVFCLKKKKHNTLFQLATSTTPHYT